MDEAGEAEYDVSYVFVAPEAGGGGGGGAFLVFLGARGTG